jgi:hypothetical protein
MSDEEIISEHGKHAGNMVIGTQHYLDELARRDAVRQGKRMERLTVSINRLTVVILIAIIAGVILTGIGLYLG